jgi:hypothetical protein
MAKKAVAKKTKATKKSAAPAPSTKETRIARGDVYEEKLPCAIPIEEVHAAGLQLANTIGARAAWLEKRKVENAKARDDRAYFDTRIEELGEAIKQQSVTRRVQCQDYLVKRGDQTLIEVVRIDTNEKVLEREPNADELQETMGFGEGEPAKGKKGKKAKPEDLAPKGPLGAPVDGLPGPDADDTDQLFGKPALP